MGIPYEVSFDPDPDLTVAMHNAGREEITRREFCVVVEMCVRAYDEFEARRHAENWLGVDIDPAATRFGRNHVSVAPTVVRVESV